MKLSPKDQEHLKYAIEIKKRDGYTAIQNYLTRSGVKGETYDYIIDEVRKAEKERIDSAQPPTFWSKINYNKIAGVSAISLGIILTILLYNKGWIATLTLVPIGIGLKFLTKKS